MMNGARDHPRSFPSGSVRDPARRRENQRLLRERRVKRLPQLRRRNMMKRRKKRSMMRRKSKQTIFDLQYSLTNIHSGLWIYISKKSLYSKLEYVV